ncbi:MAG: hypothetical protein RBT11_11265 [Desulfobacterales bacterium]|jgi:hypothetical protein|nr:hypothetical protein [Desulfobacterales bacterium]
MKIMQISKMKKNLTVDQQQAFNAELERFYAAPPKDLTVVVDYVTMDQSCSFTLLDVPDMKRLHEINKPFSPFVDYEVFEVRPASDN